MIDVIEDILLKDAQRSLDGTTATFFIDEDATFKAILNAISKKNVEEGDGVNGIKANPFISFPKSNSTDDKKSVAVGITGNAMKEAFSNGVGLIITVDNFTIRILPDAFDTEAFEESVSRYIFKKKILKEDEYKDFLNYLDETWEPIEGFEVELDYETNSGGGGSLSVLDLPAMISIIVDDNMRKVIEETQNKNDLKLYVYDEDIGSFMVIDFLYDSVSKTLTFDTKRMGRFLLSRKISQSTKTIAKPVDNADKNAKSKKPFPTFMVIISIAAAALLVAITVLLIKKFRTPKENNNDYDL